jgi:long-chain acyl-CoA synthetase
VLLRGEEDVAVPDLYGSSQPNASANLNSPPATSTVQSGSFRIKPVALVSMFPKVAEVISRFSDRKIFLTNDGRSSGSIEILGLSGLPGFKETSRRLVLCFIENRRDSLEGYLALLSSAAVPLVVGGALNRAQLSGLLNAYAPGFAWIPTSRLEEVPHSAVLHTHEEFSLVRTGSKSCYEIHDSLALLLSTSGSTGSPRFVRLSNENILSNAVSIADYLEITADDIPITTLPPSYTYGLSILHSHLMSGATIALSNQTFFDRGFWDFLKGVRATSFGGVPYHYDILKKLRFSKMDLPSLRTLTQAGGRMLPELTRDFAGDCERRGIRFFTMYGQAEATARMSYLPHAKAVEKAGSIGQAIPGGEFWLEDDAGRKMEGPTGSGELVYRGKNVCMGYAEGWSDLGRGDELGGVLRTGDLARRDAEGDYYIIGRKKRFLKMFGHRINLQDVEDFLSASGYETACAGSDDHLEVYVARPADPSLKIIKEKLVAELKIAPGAVRVFGVSELPRNEAGKIQYTQLSPDGGVSLA